MPQLTPSEEFMELLVHHQSQLFGYLFALVQDLDAAQDVFQQTSLILWRKFDTFDGDNFGAWACRTAQLEAMTYLRSERRHRAHFGSLLLEQLNEQTVASDETSQARRQALDGCLAKLSAVDRELVQKCYSRNEKFYAIAEQMGRSAQSLNNSLRRIRRALFDCINRTLARENRA